ncbi:MAG: hypothetical protein COA79_23445 [Planctomycetota bacterium]|nr:MAG: hypothetical protein COA79_23445 [Planctomycetota bacterium]
MKYKILIVDDHEPIHEDFKKILNNKVSSTEEFDALNKHIFNEDIPKRNLPDYEIHSAFQGTKAIEMVEESVGQNKPFALIFVDVNLPPGLNGIKVIQKIYEIDPNVEIVICSANSNYSIKETTSILPVHDKILFIAKPFTTIEVLQMANCLCSKWQTQMNVKGYINSLEELASSKSQYLKILIESAISINQTTDMKESFLAVLEQICNNSSFCGSHVYLVNEDGILSSSDIWYFQNVGNIDSFVKKTYEIHSFVKLGCDMPGNVLEEKIPIICKFSDGSDFPERKEEALKAGFCSMIGLPILLGRRVMGVIELYLQVEENISNNLIEVLNETTNLLSRCIERHFTEEELKKSREKALIASKAKSEFLANMSHEIRTPLNAILGYTQILRRNDNLSDTIKEKYLKVIDTSGNHLLGIINTILELSKMEAGRYELKISPFNLKALLIEVKAMFIGKCTENKLYIELDIGDQLPDTVMCDSNKIRQILINIINNSIKHTIEGGVTISCLWSNDSCTIEISDTGAGISEKHLEDIFKPFFQIEALENREGTGLGLSIVKKDVELLRGEIKYQSTINQGTTCTLEIPMPAANGAIVKTEGIPQILGLKEGENWNILLIDNDTIGRDMLYDVFMHNGFNVNSVSFSEDVLNICKSFAPNIVFFNLGNINDDTVRIIGEILELNSKLILIAMTVDGSEESWQIANKLGCHDLFQKPFDVNNMLYSLSKHLPIIYNSEAPRKKDTDKIKNVIIDFEKVGKLLNTRHLEILWDHFSTGDLSSIEEYVLDLKGDNPELDSFCDQVVIWAKDFKDIEIGHCLEQLEKYKGEGV